MGFWRQIGLIFGTRGFSSMASWKMESKFENVYIQNIEISKNGIFDEMT
jgi:hypothetical protein